MLTDLITNSRFGADFPLIFRLSSRLSTPAKLDEAECKTIPNAVWSGGLCIEAVRGPKSWYDALEACAETPGTLLAFLPDASVAAGLELEPDVAYWIDLTVRQWEWFSCEWLTAWLYFTVVLPHCGVNLYCEYMSVWGWLYCECIHAVVIV